jgi:diguanylate cyclase (GGDEF)-like protein/PAS domain S-box-containing protein
MNSMLPDVKTLIFCALVLNYFMSLGLWIYGKSQKTYPGFRLWLAGMVISALTYTLFALRGVAPDLLTIPLANAMGVLGSVIRLEGIKQFAGEKKVWYPNFIWPVLVFVAVSFFTFVRDDILARNTIFSIVTMLVAWRVSWILLRTKWSESPIISRFFALLLFLYGLTLAARGISWFIWPENRGLTATTPFNSIYFMLVLIFDISWPICLILLNGQRMADEIKNLSKKLAQLSQGVEQSPTSVVITDLKGRIEYVNPHFTELTGYSAREAYGKNPRILQSGRTPRETYQKMWETILAGTPWRGEFLNKKKNGELYWEKAVITPVKDQDGRIFNFIAIKEDITDRKEAEVALQESESRQRALNKELEKRIKEIAGLEAELREQAIRDPLTGLYNRRYLNETIDREFERARRHGQPISILMIDIDHFKKINDTYGHLAGDACLEVLADLLQQITRKADIACRYGGEEFLLLLPGAQIESAALRAEELRKIFENSVMPYDGREIKNTISIGMAAYPADGDSHYEIIDKADQALYSAKNTGRNRVVTWNILAKP